jgi:tRNA(fMet)-specific endonuclease VapC
MWILDTDHVSLFQRRNTSVVQTIQSKQPQELAVTVVTYEEQLRGWLNVVRRSSDNNGLILSYRKLNEALEFFCDQQILAFTEVAAVEYAQLLQQKLRVGTQDLRIAAITLSVGGVLVTRNRQDFERVPNLQIEDWTC